MTSFQSRVVAEVYHRFMEGEEEAGWDELDDQLEHLQNLEDDQLTKEVGVQLYYHNGGKVACGQEFCNQECYAQTVVEAVICICDLYAETHNLHKNNRYILCYYLALSQLGMIIPDITK